MTRWVESDRRWDRAEDSERQKCDDDGEKQKQQRGKANSRRSSRQKKRTCSDVITVEDKDVMAVVRRTTIEMAARSGWHQGDGIQPMKGREGGLGGRLVCFFDDEYLERSLMVRTERAKQRKMKEYSIDDENREQRVKRMRNIGGDFYNNKHMTTNLSVIVVMSN